MSFAHELISGCRTGLLQKASSTRQRAGSEMNFGAVLQRHAVRVPHITGTLTRAARLGGSAAGCRRVPAPLLSDAIQVAVGTQENLAIAHRGRGVGTAVVVGEDVVRHQLKLWLGRHHISAVML
jgi:hypothetical protein